MVLASSSYILKNCYGTPFLMFIMCCNCLIVVCKMKFRGKWVGKVYAERQSSFEKTMPESCLCGSIKSWIFTIIPFSFFLFPFYCREARVRELVQVLLRLIAADLGLQKLSLASWYTEQASCCIVESLVLLFLYTWEEILFCLWFSFLQNECCII